ncbi:MAG TPA: M28 family peptidase [Pedobacter sp.]|nr:M28 family peptidase [Pedobacter sp.]
MKKVAILLLLLYSSCSFAQDLAYTHKTLSTLTSPNFWGRGYTKNGMAKTADYLAQEFKTLGLTPMNGSAYKQSFTFPVNSFPGKMMLKINGKTLAAGKDFIVHQASRGLSSKGLLIQSDSSHYIAQEQKLIISLQPKLTWSVATKMEDFTAISIQKEAITEPLKSFDIAIENDFIPQFKAANVCAMVKGTEHPDSIIVITAHYDHLGGMGNDIYFPGANDNASGVSLLLNLAKFYAKNPQPYTIAFICFAAEEAGLIGSKYFTENPLIKLSQIRFLLNLDLVGTGDTGATVVNATVYPKEFSLLNSINDTHKFLPKINLRGKAANSDHYFFTEKGVPAFFLYTQGGISAYHDVNDKAETLPLTAYRNLFNLILKFNTGLMESANH